MQARSLSWYLYSVHMQYCLFLYWIAVIMITHYSAGAFRCFHETSAALWHWHALCRNSGLNIMRAYVNSAECVSASMHKVLNTVCWILWWLPVFPLMQYISKAQGLCLWSDDCSVGSGAVSHPHVMNCHAVCIFAKWSSTTTRLLITHSYRTPWLQQPSHQTRFQS